MLRRSSIPGVLVVAGSITAMAASPGWSQSTATETVQQIFVRHIPPGQPMERYLTSLRNDFAMADADADGRITQRDVDLHTLMEGVQARKHAISMVMGYDLDGDGFVTEDEIRRYMAYNLRTQTGPAAANKSHSVGAQIDNTVRTIMALDTDKDGKVGLAEGANYGAPGAERRGMNGQAARARQLLTIDGVAKESLTSAEFQSAGEALFRQIDTDRDGVVSQQELQEHHTRAARAGCEAPAASENAQVVLLGSYQTEALSSVTLGSQDNVVHAGRIVVEPGSEPLYLVIASYSPTIWQFRGAVERVERVVMTSSRTGPNAGEPNQRSLVGATGIAQDKVSFFSKSNCLAHFYEAPSAASLQTAAAIRAGTGKAPGVVAAKYAVTSFNVPSGTTESLRDEKKGPLIIEKTQGTLRVIGNAGNVVVRL